MKESSGPRPEIYVSTDVEADGPIPGEYSMLSIAAAAFTDTGEIVSTFTANLETLPAATTDSSTMDWWATQPEAWAACRESPRPAADAMADYRDWVLGLPGIPVFVAYPTGFDFTFVHWYLVKFTDGDPFGHHALDIRSFAMAVMGSTFKRSAKSRMPAAWIPDSPHTHIALDDAIEQGQLFCAILAASRDAATGAGSP